MISGKQRTHSLGRSSVRALIVVAAFVTTPAFAWNCLEALDGHTYQCQVNNGLGLFDVSIDSVALDESTIGLTVGGLDGVGSTDTFLCGCDTRGSLGSATVASSPRFHCFSQASARTLQGVVGSSGTRLSKLQYAGYHDYYPDPYFDRGVIACTH